MSGIRGSGCRGLKLPYLKTWRYERGIKSQRELAEKSGVSIGSIRRLEQGIGGCEADTAKKLATTLDVSVFQLTGRQQPERRRTYIE